MDDGVCFFLIFKLVFIAALHDFNLPIVQIHVNRGGGDAIPTSGT